MIRRQAYEWRNVVPANETKSYVLGHPVINPSAGARCPAIPARVPIDIFTGGYGNNLDSTADLRATQFIIIDSIAGWDGTKIGIPGGGNGKQSAFVAIRVETTRYFVNPDGTFQPGLPTSAVPFPDTISTASGIESVFTFGDFKDGLPTPVYILPGQTWGIEFYLPDGSPTYTAENDYEIHRAFVKYLLLEDTDMIIAMQLLMDGVPVTVENINSYRRSLIRQQLYLDSTTPISKGTRRLS